MATDLFTPIRLGGLELPNRIVMAPLTRNRAGQPGNVPQPINATYYAQRASAGLIITEGSPISDMAHGYPGTPGIHSPAQVAGWKRVKTRCMPRAGASFCSCGMSGESLTLRCCLTMRCQWHPPPSNRRGRHSPVRG